MRTRNIAGGLVIMVLAFTAVACGDPPTGPVDAGLTDDVVTPVDAQWSKAQSRITLCHRTTEGAYTMVTVADAAYDTHMAHGDRAASKNNLCPSDGLSVLSLSWGSTSNAGPVSVDFWLGTEGFVPLPECAWGESCEYFVPTGSAVRLSGLYDFDVVGCDVHLCQMSVDRNVVVNPVPEW